MACCSAEPPDRNKKGGKKQDQMHKFYDYTETFQISMCDSITKGQPCCCIGFLPCCIPCVQYHMREKVHIFLPVPEVCARQRTPKARLGFVHC